MASVSFVVPGKPFAKQRPIFGQGHARTPEATVRFESIVREIGARTFADPLAGAVRVVIVATFAIPASWSKKRKADARFHAQKPDADNLAKAVKDGLNRVAWADDGQVAELLVRKRWGETAETRVTVESIEAAA